MHPLLNPASPAPFLRNENGRRLPGRVFSQHQNQHRKIAHPFCFYVEYPEHGPIHEVSARRLAAIIGDGGTARSFSRIDLARTLENLDAVMDLTKLLPKLTP